MKPTVSSHAIARYQERVEALPPLVAEQLIAAAVQRGVDAGASAVKLNRVTFVLSGPRVVTVLTGVRPRDQRVRRHCRRQIAFNNPFDWSDE